MNGNATKVIGGILASLLVAAIIALAALFDRVSRLEASLGSAQEARQMSSALVRLQGEVDGLKDFRSQGRRFTWDDGQSVQRDLKEIEKRLEDLERRRR